MTAEEFTQLVRRAERHAARSPAAYRVRVILLGALGYLYVWFLIAAALGGLALLAMSVWPGAEGARGSARLAGEVAVPVVIFVGILFRALWVKLDAPEGKPLDRQRFPELHAALDEIRDQLQGPKLHAVLLDDQFNASITQIPRLGVFGWHRNYLVVGLPLLQMLSPRQLVAVLAHEYGHLSGAHGKLGTWIYRVRTTWMQLLTAFHEKRARGAELVRRFFEWYAPYFSAYSFALARANEYEADRCAARVAGASHMGAALVRVETAGAYFATEYWPSLYRTADSQPRPEGQPFGRLARRAGAVISQERAGRLLEQALAAPTDVGDTHPSLADRLRSLGLEAELPDPLGETAAEAFLGEHLRGIVTEFDLRWRAAATPVWRERYESVQTARARLRDLYQGPESDRTPQELLERARLVDQLAGRKQALPQYRRALEADPSAPLPLCVVGLSLLEEGDESGLEMLERGMALDEGLAVGACQAVRDHFAAAGDMGRATTWHERAVRQAEKAESAMADRASIPLRAVYEPHDLPPDVVQHVVTRLRADPFVRHAMLACKKLEHAGEPVYVLGVVGKLRLAVGEDRRAIARRIVERLDVDQDISCVVAEGPNKKLATILAKVPGAKLF